MRISDWSSDVCSSDLLRARRPDAGVAIGLQLHADLQRVALGLRSARLCLADLVRNAADRLDMVADIVRDDIGLRGVARGAHLAVEFAEEGGVEIDRKRVGKGTSVSVRVDLVGRRYIKKNKQPNKK